MLDDNHVMNIKEVASYIGCGESSIRKLLKQNILYGHKIGNKWLFKKQYIDEWLDGFYNHCNEEIKKGEDKYGIFRNCK